MTVLVIGGAYQGKKAWAMQQFSLSELDFGSPQEKTRAVNCLHHFTKLAIKQDINPKTWLLNLRGRIILCDEIGCGIIPCNEQEALWREETGRLCCLLAAEADAVVLIRSGIAQVIKGSLA